MLPSLRTHAHTHNSIMMMLMLMMCKQEPCEADARSCASHHQRQHDVAAVDDVASTAAAAVAATLKGCSCAQHYILTIFWLCVCCRASVSISTSAWNARARARTRTQNLIDGRQCTNLSDDDDDEEDGDGDEDERDGHWPANDVAQREPAACVRFCHQAASVAAAATLDHSRDACDAA